MTPKEQLRKQLRQRLATIDAVTTQDVTAQAVADRVLQLPEIEQAQGILSCLSFGTEIDTWHLVDRLIAAGKRLYVPRTEPRTRALHLHPYPCELRSLSFGLQEPVRHAPALAEGDVESSIDVVLVLGLGFDRDGYRLGYGGGYFDRFLARYPLTAIGLAYQLQMVDTLPKESHDVPMTAVVTEDGVWRAGSRGEGA